MVRGAVVIQDISIFPIYSTMALNAKGWLLTQSFYNLFWVNTSAGFVPRITLGVGSIFYILISLLYDFKFKHPSC